jgi:mannose-6-phosphate isomerase-like protein (cupin superfamily)
MLTELPSVSDPRGKLVFMEAGQQVPFPIRRVFFLHDLTPGHERGNHAHRSCHEFLVVVAGALTIELDNGRRRWRRFLIERHHAVHVPPMHWIVLRDFDASTVCMVLTSERYDPEDYIRDYPSFLSEAKRAER